MDRLERAFFGYEDEAGVPIVGAIERLWDLAKDIRWLKRATIALGVTSVIAIINKGQWGVVTEILKAIFAHSLELWSTL